MVQPGPQLDRARDIVHTAARGAGRDPDAIGMDGRVEWRGDVDDLVRRVEAWRAEGATGVSINTMGAGLPDVDAHLEALAQVAAVVGLR
jgi:hypothetical protein